MLLIVVPLALLAAVLYSVSDFLEQRAAHRASHTDPETEPLPSGSKIVQGWRSVHATAHRMVHDRQWFAGWAVGTVAYLVQGVALHFGSVAVVQSLQVTTLLFNLPLSAIGRNVRPRWPEWLGGFFICAGLAILLDLRRHGTGSGEADRPRILLMFLFLGIAVVVLLGIAIIRSGIVRATALACAAGAAFASSATLVKLTADDLTTHGIAHTATDWPGYALAVATTTGLVLQQAAFASGRLPTATTAMVVTNPVVGTAVAIVGFDEKLPRGPLALAALAAAAALIAAGVAILARSPLLHDDDDDALDDRGVDAEPDDERAHSTGRPRVLRHSRGQEGDEGPTASHS